MDWENDFTDNQIEYTLKDRIIRLKNTDALKDYLQEDGNGSLELADFLRGEYEKRYHRELAITRHSLAIEILGHVFFDSLSLGIMRLLEQNGSSAALSVRDQLHKIESHAAVIDCGEKSEDGNRWVWDFLAPFHGLIYRYYSRLRRS